MSPSVAKQLVRYRSWFVAIANATITWIILIIAPLGLFAVITCTLGVFLSSLIIGWMLDRALFQLLRVSNRDVMSARRESANFSTGLQSEMESDFLPKQRRTQD